MKSIIENAMICEVNTVPNKENKVFPCLVVMEQGKNSYQNVKRIRINAEEITKLMPHVGQVHDIHVESEERSSTKGNYTTYQFIGLSKKTA